MRRQSQVVYTNFRHPAYNYDKTVCGLIDAWVYELDRLYLLNGVRCRRSRTFLHMRLIATSRSVSGDSRLARTQPMTTWDESYTMPENLLLAWQRGLANAIADWQNDSSTRPISILWRQGNARRPSCIKP